MNKIKFTCFHGSPGAPSDFHQLVQALNECTFNTPNRYNNEKFTMEDYIIGHSWGAKIALENCFNHFQKNNVLPKGIILIAPYIFREEKNSFLKKLTLKTPFFGSKLLKHAGEKSLKDHLAKSFSPQTIDEQLQSNLLKTYCRVKSLKKSIFEKDDDQVDHLISFLKNHHIKLLIISGADDLVSPLEQQTRPLVQMISHDCPVKSVELQQQGHALLWSATDQIAHIIREWLQNSEKQEKGKIGYYPNKDSRNNVATFLEEHLHNFPTRSALKWVDQEDLNKWDFNLKTPLPHSQISIQELRSLVSKIGAGLTQKGIKKGDRVIIFIPMSLPLYAAMFALQKIGAIAVFLDSWARRDQLGVSAQVASPKAIISVEQAFDYLVDVTEIQEIDFKVIVGPSRNPSQYHFSLEELMTTGEESKIEEVDKEDTALITFTTGSSGTPKGADRGHRFLASQHYALNRHIPYTDSDVDLPSFPIFSLNNLAAGVTTVIPAIDIGRPHDMDPVILIAQMKACDVTCTTLSPSLMRRLSLYCFQNKIELNFLRRIVTGGAPVSNDDVELTKKIAPHAQILILYGSTEVEPMAHVEANEMLAQQKLNTDPDVVDRGVMVGKMDSGLRYKFIKIIKDQVKIDRPTQWEEIEVNKGEDGELIVSGEHVCEKYFNNQEAFNKSKIVDTDGSIWHRTGDLGHLDQQGRLWLVGRVHNAIKRMDSYHYPVRAEIVMKKLDFVEQCAYLGVDDSSLGQKIIAAFSTKENCPHDDAYMIEKIKNIFHKNKITADQIIRVKNIPMDPRHHSKVEYSILREDLR